MRIPAVWISGDKGDISLNKLTYLLSDTLVTTLKSWAARSLAIPKPISPMDRMPTVAKGVSMEFMSESGRSSVSSILHFYCTYLLHAITKFRIRVSSLAHRLFSFGVFLGSRTWTS